MGGDGNTPNGRTPIFQQLAWFAAAFGVNVRTLKRQAQRDQSGHPRPVLIGKNTRKYHVEQMLEYYRRRGGAR